MSLRKSRRIGAALCWCIAFYLVERTFSLPEDSLFLTIMLVTVAVMCAHQGHQIEAMKYELPEWLMDLLMKKIDKILKTGDAEN
ncbi:MAG: hypothetical protein HQM09_14715 [Candidatus Riflebacteria bacterium]|nr:hypothetical protein [Candidatus Riflebacteria bacterium]